MISEENRREANISVDKIKRYKQIKEILNRKGPLTAKEVAVELYRLKYTDNSDRNNAAPRLTELNKIYKEVEVVGKKICKYTGKNVAVYQLTPQAWEQKKFI